MEHKFLSVEEISKILELHPKTVRRFIREGKLKARKIGRTWKVLEDELKMYTHGEAGEHSEFKNTPEISSFDSRIRISTVIEISEGSSDEANRISNSLIALLNSKDPTWGKNRYDFFYDAQTDKARFILYGSPKFLSVVLNMFDTLTQKKD